MSNTLCCVVVRGIVRANALQTRRHSQNMTACVMIFVKILRMLSPFIESTCMCSKKSLTNHHCAKDVPPDDNLRDDVD